MTTPTGSPTDDVRDRFILGLAPDGVGFICADCGVTADVSDAARYKSCLIFHILCCEERTVDLFIDPALPARALEWLRRLGLGPGAAADLIGAARQLGLLGGEGPDLRFGAARCKDCYFRRAESFLSGSHRVAQA